MILCTILILLKSKYGNIPIKREVQLLHPAPFGRPRRGIKSSKVMTVEEFNTDKGLYIFEVANFKTEFHSHPPIEIIIALKGSFSVSIEETNFDNLQFAVIAANQKHKLSAPDCIMKVIMIEHHNKLVCEKLGLSNIKLNVAGYFSSTLDQAEAIIDPIVLLIKEGNLASEYDDRISAVIDYLNYNALEYKSMIKTLQSITHLSESRLSHLFKSNIGISLKKYLIWTRIRSTIKQYLNSQEGLLSSTIDNGFYDQPHFSRNFKNMLGVKPSMAYNSRNLQVSTNRPL